MKTEDFERLKKICEKEGFIVSQGGLIPSDSILVEVFKKDPWEGVEFAQSIKSGDIYSIKELNEKMPKDCIIDNFKPSTEELYIEQLKKTAYEKLGEIKEGQFFKFEEKKVKQMTRDKIWAYAKKDDTLYLNGITIYQQGKWAKRIEKVEVDVPFANYHKGMKRLTVNFDISSHEIYRRKEVDEISKFLAKHLENYLNNEQGN